MSFYCATYQLVSIIMEEEDLVDHQILSRLLMERADEVISLLHDTQDRARNSPKDLAKLIPIIESLKQFCEWAQFRTGLEVDHLVPSLKLCTRWERELHELLEPIVKTTAGQLGGKSWAEVAGKAIDEDIHDYLSWFEKERACMSLSAGLMTPYVMTGTPRRLIGTDG